MSDPAGWVPAYRKVFEPDHWLAPTRRAPASRLHAWLDLCQMATWQPRETYRSGTLNRGEVVASMRTLGDRWKWGKDAVRDLLVSLEKHTAIQTVRQTPDGTVYRIVKYDTYAVGTEHEPDSKPDSEPDRCQTDARQEQEVKHSRSKERPLFISPQKNKKSSLPDGWIPNDTHRKRSASDHLNVEREAEKFRAHHLARGSLFMRWDQAFTTWLLNATDFRKTNGNGVPPDSEAARWDVEAVRAKEARAFARDHADREIERLNVEARNR